MNKIEKSTAEELAKIIRNPNSSDQEVFAALQKRDQWLIEYDCGQVVMDQETNELLESL